jgi:hypothetical protein
MGPFAGAGGLRIGAINYRADEHLPRYRDLGPLRGHLAPVARDLSRSPILSRETRAGRKLNR